MTVAEELRIFRKEFNLRFDENSDRFSKIDIRFDKIDERFAKIDEKFDQIDERFAKVDIRFDKVDARFDKVEVAISQQTHQMTIMFEQMQKTIKDALLPSQDILKVERKVENHGERISTLERDTHILKTAFINKNN